MYPILGRYGPFFLYSFTVTIGVGLLAAIGLTAWQASRSSSRRPDWLDGVLFSLLPALLIGRIGYIWANRAYFQAHPEEMGLIWHGGLSYHGALLGGLVAFWFWSWWRGRRSFGAYADLLAPGLALGNAFGWFACWLEGCAYGRETFLNPLAADLPDSFGVYGLRYQTQWLGVGLSLLLMAVALWAQRRRLRPSGTTFWLTLLLLSGGRLLLTFLRGDAVPQLDGWRIDSLLDGLLMLWASLPLLLGRLRVSNPEQGMSSVNKSEQEIS